MKFIGTKAECRALRDARAYAEGYPFPPDQLRDANEVTRLRSRWLAATPAEREILRRSGEYDGWTLFPEDAYPEPEGDEDTAGEKLRWVLDVPEDLDETAPLAAATVHKRTLDAAQLQVLTEAPSKALADFPPDWKGKRSADVTTKGSRP